MYDVLAACLEPNPSFCATVKTYKSAGASTAKKTYLHYAGRLSVHPDTSGAFYTKLKRNLQKGQCRYGVKCLDCPTFINAEIERQRVAGVVEKIKPRLCDEFKNAGCIGRKKQINAGKKIKTFGVTTKTYNELTDRAAWLYHNSDFRLLFITLTFPKFKKQVNEKELNNAFSRFIENLKNNYFCRHYIAVREGDGVNIRYHYHVVCDVPYQPFYKLNRAWLHSISDFCEFSARAVTSNKKARLVKSTAGLIRYLCKYLSKSRGNISGTRVIFTDRATAQAQIKSQLNETPLEFLTQYKTLTRYVYNDFCASFSFTDRAEHNKFIKDVVLTWFGCKKRKNYAFCYKTDNESDTG